MTRTFLLLSFPRSFSDHYSITKILKPVYGSRLVKNGKKGSKIEFCGWYGGSWQRWMAFVWNWKSFLSAFRQHYEKIITKKLFTPHIVILCSYYKNCWNVVILGTSFWKMFEMKRWTNFSFVLESVRAERNLHNLIILMHSFTCLVVSLGACTIGKRNSKFVELPKVGW